MKTLRETVKDCEHVHENVAESLEKVKALNEKLNAVITYCDVEKEIAEMPETGLLRGCPVIVKDNVSTKGVRTTAGSRILSNYVPPFDATLAKKIKEQGGIMICKSSMDELAMGGANMTAYTGWVRNPWDTERTPGGSSGGSAALMGCLAAPLAIGSDTGDSIRKPGCWCGTIGVKPTYGRISRYGVIPYASSLDHVGYFTSNVEDAALALQALSGRDDNDMTSANEPVKDWLGALNSDMTGRKIAVLGNVLDAMNNRETVRQFNEIVEQLKQRGAIVDVIYMDNDLMRCIYPTYNIIANAESVSNNSDLDGVRFGVRKEGDDLEEIMINSRTEGFSYGIRRRFTIGSYALEEENLERLFFKAQKVRRKISENLEEVMQGYEALLAPTSGDIAARFDDMGKGSEALSDNNLISENHLLLENFNGWPSMSIPMSFQEGCPLGISIASHAFDEQAMFDVAKAIEEITGYENICAEVK